METAIAYIRVSDPRQVIDGNSLATQERQVRDHATARGYELIRVFTERGESAKSDDRTVLKEMLGFCKERAGKIQVLIFPKIDRFARYLPDYISLKSQLSRLNIRVDSVGEPIENSPAGRLTEHMLAAIAQFDNEVRAERSKGGAIQAAREGRWVSRPPFGYRRVRIGGSVTIEPDPVQSPIVAGLFERLSAGEKPTEVRHWLASKGVTYVRSYVHKLARNKVYIGMIERFGETNVGRPPFVPLVSRSLFEAAQLAFRTRNLPKVYNRDNPGFPLRGTVRCECGHYLMGAWSHGRNRRYAYYRCHWCSRVNHPRDFVHRIFCRQLREQSPNLIQIEHLRRKLEKRLNALQGEFQSRRGQLERRLQEIESLRRAIANKNASGVIPDDIAREQLEETAVQVEAARRQLAGLALPQEDLPELLRFAEEFFTDIDLKWREASILLQKKLQRFAFPEGIVITRDGGLRTTEDGPIAGLKASAHAQLFSSVHPGDISPNPVRRKKQADADEVILADLLEHFKNLYDELGPESPLPFSSK